MCDTCGLITASQQHVPFWYQLAQLYVSLVPRPIRHFISSDASLDIKWRMGLGTRLTVRVLHSPASWTLLTFYFISARKAKMGRRVQQQSLALHNI